ncbi:MAG TPA: glycerol-3-phosphate 1-O-acyltransferase PlsY [Planctomycetota bacterium]
MGVGAQLALAAAGGYLLGSVSFALLMARLHGVDLAMVGSGNPGATNVSRALGVRVGVLVFLLDALKGLLAAWCALRLASEAPLTVAVAAGAGAVSGHCWPFWRRFRGGKGVATLSGVMLALDPLALLLAGSIWLAGLLATRFMSVASMGLAVGLPLAVWLRDREAATAERLPLLGFALGAGLLLVWTHRGNLARLAAGTENRLGRRA